MVGDQFHFRLSYQNRARENIFYAQVLFREREIYTQRMREIHKEKERKRIISQKKARELLMTYAFQRKEKERRD